MSLFLEGLTAHLTSGIGAFLFTLIRTFDSVAEYIAALQYTAATRPAATPDEAPRTTEAILNQLVQHQMEALSAARRIAPDVAAMVRQQLRVTRGLLKSQKQTDADEPSKCVQWQEQCFVCLWSRKVFCS